MNFLWLAEKTEIDNLIVFLRAVGQGAISGNVSEWPQLKPACALASRVIEWSLNNGYIPCVESDDLDQQDFRDKLCSIAREVKL